MQTLNDTSKLDAIIVGSGPAGATLANELPKRGQKVAILEWGTHEPINPLTH